MAAPQPEKQFMLAATEQDEARATTAPKPKVFDATAPYFRTAGAAWYCGVSNGHMRNLRHAGGGPPYRLANGRAIYARADLDAWLASSPKYRSTSERSAHVGAAA
jgi:hypothetical protein